MAKFKVGDWVLICKPINNDNIKYFSWISDMDIFDKKAGKVRYYNSNLGVWLDVAGYRCEYGFEEAWLTKLDSELAKLLYG